MRVKLAFTTMLLVVCVAGGTASYLTGRSWIRRFVAPAGPATHQPNLRDGRGTAGDDDEQERPAGPGGNAAAVTRHRPAQPIELPALGTLDWRMLEGDDRVAILRKQARAAFMRYGREVCGPSHAAGDTWVEALLRVSLVAGTFRLMGVDAIQVKRGSPLNEPTRDCLARLFTPPLTIPPPRPPSGASPEHRVRWVGFPDLDGDFMVELALGDKVCQADVDGAGEKTGRAEGRRR